MSVLVPVVAIVGRPNVGKSTLFNALTNTREALVFDKPGVTRDPIYGRWRIPGHALVLIDTGGISDDPASHLESLVCSHARQVIHESDLVLLLLDAKAGLHPDDQALSQYCRENAIPVLAVVNKSDGLDPHVAMADFYALGFPSLELISASHRRGLEKLSEKVLDVLKPELIDVENSESQNNEARRIQLAIVGRPNVGKSTLVNRILGEERQVVCDMPGTTLDSVSIPFEKQNVLYTLVDTAGIRRKGRVDEGIEKFSVVKSLQAIESSDVALMILDATEGVTDQDRHILGYILDSGRSLVLAVNKWDGLSDHHKEEVRAGLSRTLMFVSFAKMHFISALHGTNVGHLFKSVEKAYYSSICKVSTPDLNQLLEAAQKEHQPPLVRGRRIKLRYAHLGGHQPPVLVIHGNQVEHMPQHYLKFLENFFREALKLEGTPVRVELKSGENPFAGRRNKLTKRQIHKKKRLFKHVKK